jgi:hypothetical protein
MLTLIQHVCTALDAQGRKSTTADTHGCRYRGQDGTKCAVGHLIDDAHYDPDFDDDICPLTAHDPDVIAAVRASHPNHTIDPAILQQLQEVHDIHWTPDTETFTQAWEDHREH